MRYAEVPPSEDLQHVVHCYWELRTVVELSQDFHYHALPDACVNLLFNLVDTEIAGITALQNQATVLNLGTSFHYAGVQLYPGAWQGDPDEIQSRYVGTPYRGQLPLTATAKRLIGLDLDEMAPVLDELVRWCLQHGDVTENPITARILANLDAVRTVADMAKLVALSPRQLQRTLKRATGFAPHDLLKVLRLQQSFRQHYLAFYADQAHFTNAFRKAVGLTPGQYRKQFGV